MYYSIKYKECEICCLYDTDMMQIILLFVQFIYYKYFYSYSTYGARYMAFFNPAQSGRHTFFIKADDSAVLYLQKGRNITDLSE